MKTRYIGNLLKQHRKQAGLTQGELAKMFGYSAPQYISNVERGICSFNPHHANKLAKILKIDKRTLVDAYVGDFENQIERLIL